MNPPNLFQKLAIAGVAGAITGLGIIAESAKAQNYVLQDLNSEAQIYLDDSDPYGVGLHYWQAGVSGDHFFKAIPGAPDIPGEWEYIKVDGEWRNLGEFWDGDGATSLTNTNPPSGDPRPDNLSTTFSSNFEGTSLEGLVIRKNWKLTGGLPTCCASDIAEETSIDNLTGGALLIEFKEYWDVDLNGDPQDSMGEFLFTDQPC
jgi:hypothetical protein